MSFLEAIVLDYCWHLPLVLKPGWNPRLHAFLPACYSKSTFEFCMINDLAVSARSGRYKSVLYWCVCTYLVFKKTYALYDPLYQDNFKNDNLYLPDSLREKLDSVYYLCDESIFNHRGAPLRTFSMYKWKIHKYQGEKNFTTVARMQSESCISK